MFFSTISSEKRNLVIFICLPVSDMTTIIVSKKMLCLLFHICRLSVGTPSVPLSNITSTVLSNYTILLLLLYYIVGWV